MSETLTINNLSTTYVEKLRPNNIFYNNNFLLCGIFYINLYSYDTYKTLINFSLPNIDVNSIEKISLFLYLDNARIYNTLPFTLSLSSAVAPYNVFTTNWINQPNINPSNIIITNINSFKLGTYTEIDITNIVKNAYANFNGIILENTGSKYNSILRFTSTNSTTPPYILISYSKKTTINTEAPKTTISTEAPSTSSIKEEIAPISSESISIPADSPDISNIKESVTKLEEQYKSLKELILSATNKPATLPSNLITQESFNELTNTINERINTFSQKVNSSNDELKKYHTDLEGIHNELNTLSKSISSNNGTVSNAAANYEEKLTSLDTKLITFDEKLANFNNVMNTLNLNYDLVKHNMTSMDETISSLVDHLAEIEVKLATTTKIPDFSAKVDSLNKSVNDLHSSLNTVIETSTSNIDKINARIANLENSSTADNINTLSTDLSSTINNFKSLEEKIAPLSTGLSELKSQYEALKQQINAISITPLNLL